MVDERSNQSRAEISNLCLTLAGSTWPTGVRRWLSAPKVLEPVGRQFGVAHSVLDVLVPQPSPAAPACRGRRHRRWQTNQVEAKLALRLPPLNPSLKKWSQHARSPNPDRLLARPH